MRCCAGTTSTNSPSSPRRKPQPRCTCWISDCALYCVSTPIWRMPELTQLDSGKSMMRNLPPKGIAGLARYSGELLAGATPRPPARISASVSRVRRLTKRPDRFGVIRVSLICARWPGLLHTITCHCNDGSNVPYAPAST